MQLSITGPIRTLNLTMMRFYTCRNTHIYRQKIKDKKGCHTHPHKDMLKEKILGVEVEVPH
jgi:hypothetical protein